MSYSFYGCSSLTNVTIPYSVTYIGGHAFWGCSSLTNVTIPYGVTYIDERAFWGCSSLRNVTIPDSVTNIEEGAFHGCSSLTNITIPDSVTSLGDSAFRGCSSLTSVTIPDSVTSIEDSLFNGCSSLSSVTIADGITSIGDLAFNGCSSLTSVTLPGSVTSLGLLVFGSCDNFESINVSKNSKSFCSVDGVLFSKDKTRLKLYPQAKLNTLYSIPENVVSISSYAFVGCNNIVGIVIPVSVKSIDWHSFANCSNLKDVYYSGSQSQWKAIDIDDDNDNLLNAKIHYNYVAAPTISITTSAGHPKLSWKAVDGATKYYVYRSTDGKKYSLLVTTEKTSVTNSKAKIGTTYYYKVKAAKVVNSKTVKSAYSNVKSIKCVPAAPVVSISRSNGKPKLTWKAVTGASKYYIYRSTDGKTYKQYTTTTKTTYTNTGAASGKKYYYKVKAVAVVNKKNVFSAYSTAKNLMTTIATPSVSITTVNGKPKVSWKAVTGADKYIVYRSTDGKTFKQLSTTTKTSLTNTGAKKNTKYYYKVKAVCTKNTNANSALSKAVSIKATK